MFYGNSETTGAPEGAASLRRTGEASIDGADARRPITAPLTDGAPSVGEPVVGHVDYVTDGAERDVPAARFLLEALSDPVTLVLLVAGGALLVAAIVGYLRVRPAARDVATFRRMLREYEGFVPLILRLSIGVPLIGAGFAGYFFTPVVQAPTRLFGIGVGFLILFGLATRCAAAVGLVAYLAGLAVQSELLLASEYAFGFVAIVLLGSGRPSVDHLIQRVSTIDGTVCCRLNPITGVVDRLNRWLVPHTAYALTVVRLGLGFNFAYLGLTQKILDPGPALQVVEKYDLTGVIPVDPSVWVVGAGLTEIAVGAALFVGLLTRGFATLAFLVFTVTLFGLPDDPVLAHVSLFGLASVLIIAGSGPLSIDRYLLGERSLPETTFDSQKSEMHPE